eukprot:6471211-Amphidinium_carterae.1
MHSSAAAAVLPWPTCTKASSPAITARICRIVSEGLISKRCQACKVQPYLIDSCRHKPKVQCLAAVPIIVFYCEDAALCAGQLASQAVGCIESDACQPS